MGDAAHPFYFWARRLAAGNGSDDDNRLFPGCDRIGQRSVWRFVGQILLAGEEAQERPAVKRDLVANGSAQHRIAGFERVEDGALRYGAADFQLHFAADLGQGPEMEGQDDADHGCNTR